MAVRRIGWMAVLMIAWLAAPVRAQDDPRIGITMGYPAAVGVVWRLNDNIALRPDLTYQRTSSESLSTITLPSLSVVGVPNSSPTTTVITTDSWSVGVGVSALFYISRHEALRTYLSPRWGYTWSSADGSSSGVSILATLSNSHSQTVGGSFGAQYALSRRFNVYGEVGLGYSRTTLPGSDVLGVITRTETTTSSLATRGGAGVVLYF
jgi:hypothetical protein